MAKESSLYPSIKWGVMLGDLVKVAKYDLNGIAHHLFGVVISSPQECQVEMFPYVNVYMFSSNKVSKCYPDSIEIVSQGRG